MWVKALDTVLDRMILDGATFSSVIGISGSAQQHGSVYWNQHGIDTLKKLDVDQFLYNQINDTGFAVKRTPVWMDSSKKFQAYFIQISLHTKLKRPSRFTTSRYIEAMRGNWRSRWWSRRDGSCDRVESLRKVHGRSNQEDFPTTAWRLSKDCANFPCVIIFSVDLPQWRCTNWLLRRIRDEPARHQQTMLVTRVPRCLRQWTAWETRRARSE